MGSFFEIEGRDVNVRASVGVAAGRPGIESAGDLLRNADVAMYSAKARGKGRVVVFEPSMHEAVDGPRPAVGRPRARRSSAREFVLQYQPIVEIATRPDGRRRGARALGASRARHGSGRTTSSGSPRSPTRSSRSAAGCSSQACRQVDAWHGLARAPGRSRQRQHLGAAAGPARLRRRGPGDHPRRPASSRRRSSSR